MIGAKLTPMSKSLSQLITVIVIIIVIAGMILLLPLSIENRREDLRCKARLSRLGIATAINSSSIAAAVAFPQSPILSREKSGFLAAAVASNIFWPCISQRDIAVPQRDGESDEAYVERRRRMSFAVDPTSGLPFWYNESLRGRNPQRFMTAEEQRTWYFSAQRLPDGTYPYEHQGQNGVYRRRRGGRQSNHS